MRRVRLRRENRNARARKPHLVVARLPPGERDRCGHSPEESGPRCGQGRASRSRASSSRRCHEIDGGRYGGRRGEYVLRPPVLAEPLEKRIAAERHANREERRAGRFIAQAPKDPADLLRIARVIGPRQSVRFAGATAKVRHGAAPSLLPELARKSTSVMAARVALEAVKEHNERSIGWTCQTIDIDEVAVRRVPAFPLPTRLGTADQHAVQGLQVCAGQPPGSSVGA